VRVAPAQTIIWCISPVSVTDPRTRPEEAEGSTGELMKEAILTVWASAVVPASKATRGPEAGEPFQPFTEYGGQTV
jgi:hypothetical protein